MDAASITIPPGVRLNNGAEIVEKVSSAFESSNVGLNCDCKSKYNAELYN